jgi:hypothetical protein
MITSSELSQKNKIKISNIGEYKFPAHEAASSSSVGVLWMMYVFFIAVVFAGGYQILVHIYTGKTARSL